MRVFVYFFFYVVDNDRVHQDEIWFWENYFWVPHGAMGQRNHWKEHKSNFGKARNSLCFCWPRWQHKPALLAHSRIFMPECGNGTACGSNLTTATTKTAPWKLLKLHKFLYLLRGQDMGGHLRIFLLCFELLGLVFVHVGFCALKVQGWGKI